MPAVHSKEKITGIKAIINHMLGGPKRKVAL
jgi:hypothetical protein